MPRKRAPNKVHTSPERAGEQNMKGMEFPKDEDGLMNKIMPIKKEGDWNRTTYKGLWTQETLADAVDRFFDYCTKVSFKPTIPSLAVWLGISKSQIYDWRAHPEKYGYKSEILGEALNIMEAYLQANIDKYPTGSCFLLRTSHGHIEQSKLDVTTNGKDFGTNIDEVNERIKRLGL